MWARTKTPHTESSVEHNKKSWKDFFSEDLKNHTEQGLYLKGLRLREGLTQVQLGKLIGVTQNNISSMEHGKRPISKAMAKKLATLFKTDYRMFL